MWVDRTFIYPIELIEDVKAFDWKSNNQIAEILLNTTPVYIDKIPVYREIDENLLENIGAEDPTDDLLDAIQNNIDADRLAAQNTTAKIQVSTYDSDASNAASNLQQISVEVEEGIAQLREEEEADYILLQEVLLADDVVITKVDTSFSPRFAAMRNQGAGRMEEKDLRREENLNAKNAKKGKLSSQVRVKGQKFRKSA